MNSVSVRKILWGSHKIICVSIYFVVAVSFVVGMVSKYTVAIEVWVQKQTEILLTQLKHFTAG